MEQQIKEMIQSKKWKLEDEKKYLQEEVDNVKKVIEGNNLAEIGRWLPVYGELIRGHNATCQVLAMEIDELEWLLKSIPKVEIK